MPAYNAAKYISSSIDSVLLQTFLNWELIIVDDGSTDNTKDIVQSYLEKDKRISYVWQKNGKQAKARNRGVEKTTGEWIAFLDSDDLWMPDKLQKQLDAVQKYNADVVFTSGYYLDEITKSQKPYDALNGLFSGDKLYSIILGHNHIPVLSVLIRRSIAERVGPQDESLQVHGCEDWDYWLRLCRAGASFLGMEERLFQYRVHPASTSSNKINMHLASCYVLDKNIDRSILKAQDYERVIGRLVFLVKSILPILYERGDKHELTFLLKMVERHTSSKRYRVANHLVNILGNRSRWIVNYLLSS